MSPTHIVEITFLGKDELKAEKTRDCQLRVPLSKKNFQQKQRLQSLLSFSLLSYIHHPETTNYIPMALRRLTKEATEITNDGLEMMSAGPIGDDYFQWQAMIMGPV